MIYYDKENLLIRSMMKSDIEKLVLGFAEQGWNKPYEQFVNYYNQQENSEKLVIVAEMNNDIAGYVTLLPYAETGPYTHKNIPEIVDFNVLIKYQKRGIGNQIMDIVESLVKNKSDTISLSVGLHSGYGSAQRIYIKRGYIPDGTGVWYCGKQLEQYSKCQNDDDLTLYLLKTLI
ncbi:MAG: GCN5-related N-acetyltransferase [Clostridiales bacterium]|jgi:ribosomal protein S18 acetylase RimI-like enzyme|nr:GCN5-related N-acetyltransferase [Clostridiales bacterium]